MASSRLRIVVSGMLAGTPNQGGATWAVLQYLLGLRQLGHDVCFVEPINGGRGSVAMTVLPYFEAVVSRFHLQGRAALRVSGTGECYGLEPARLKEFCDSADLLLNISGLLRDARLWNRIPRRVFLDLDPAFTQLWQKEQGIDMGFAGHTHFATIGTRLGSPGCDIPLCGRQWMATLQPVVLAEWPRATAITRDAYTTVANWRAYGSIEYRGVLLGQKAHSLRRFMSLPPRAHKPLQLALAIHSDEATDIDALRANGWQLEEPADVAATPDTYRSFVQGSRAEFGIAKSGYALSRCGWFSDRSICYLASGRPVIAQETGFSGNLPVGRGLFAFDTEDQALEAMDAIESDYGRHAAAARELAEDYFDSDNVLTGLLEAIFAPVTESLFHG